MRGTRNVIASGCGADLIAQPHAALLARYITFYWFPSSARVLSKQCFDLLGTKLPGRAGSPDFAPKTYAATESHLFSHWFALV